MDWHHPDAKGKNFPKYREEYLKLQLKELLTNYGKIGVMWFDGEWIDEWTEEQGRDLYNYVRNLQPDIIINNRVGKGRAGMQGMMKDNRAVGDFGTPEQEILENSASMDWESCMTMNNHWGFASYDKNFKTTQVLIDNIVDIAAKGGNYLLNIGPTSEGVFPEESIKRLQEIGDWMNINGEIVHNSGSIKNYMENDSLYYAKSKDGIWLYAITTRWPGKRLVIHNIIPKKDTEVKLLGYEHPLEWNDLGPDGVAIIIPDELQQADQRPCSYAWVFKMAGTEL
jgi:alpha-L-fucosidase